MVSERALSEKSAALAAELSSCSAVFTALGNETRQQIMAALLRHPTGLRVGEIAAAVNLSRPAASRHLQLMRRADVVSFYQRGTMNYYYVNPDSDAWRALSSLTGHINDTVACVMRFHSSGVCCYSEL